MEEIRRFLYSRANLANSTLAHQPASHVDSAVEHPRLNLEPTRIAPTGSPRLPFAVPSSSSTLTNRRMSENALPTTTSASYSRIDDPTTTAPQSKHHNHKRHKRKGGGGGLTSGALNSLKRPIVYLPLAGLCVVTVLVSRGWNRGMERVQGGDNYLSETMHDSLERLSKGWSTSLRGSRPNANEDDDGEWNCNPFETNGRLNVDLQDPTKTEWVPFDSRCNPSNYMKALYRPPGDTSPLIPDKDKSPHGREYLSWFKNRTIVLHGDSIDRFHLKDFCEFVGGRLELIGTDHQANPAMWKKPGGDRERRDWEKNWSERPREGQELTNPWICDVEEYGTTLINVFTWGLEGAEEFFKTERWYYPPGANFRSPFSLPFLRFSSSLTPR